MLAEPNQKVLIIGGGVFGTSTAYHAVRRGYKNVKVLDRFASPSKDSAATDLNKVVRADYPNPLYTKLGMEAMAVWKDDKSVLGGMYHESGWIMAAHDMTVGWLESARLTAEKAGRQGVKYMTGKELSQKWPALTGEFPNWTNLWSPAAGWVGLYCLSFFFFSFLFDETACLR